MVIGLVGTVFILLVELMVFVTRSLKADEVLETARQVRDETGGRGRVRVRNQYSPRLIKIRSQNAVFHNLHELRRCFLYGLLQMRHVQVDMDSYDPTRCDVSPNRKEKGGKRNLHFVPLSEVSVGGRRAGAGRKVGGGVRWCGGEGGRGTSPTR